MALLVVKVSYDREVGVWYVADSDVPGLRTEAETFEAMRDRILALAPELLELNGWRDDQGQLPAEVPIDIIAYSSGKLRLAAA